MRTFENAFEKGTRYLRNKRKLLQNTKIRQAKKRLN